ncbi:MAG: MFS transporter [Chromatiaceae bacterium]|jgi:predicted MFS family arabinose efflux permease|nr:MFS transporter [Chromatiaceae bacterium]
MRNQGASGSGSPAGWRQSPSLVVLASGLIVMISMGLRQSYGVFMQPLGCVLGIDRETFGLAIALQNLMLGLPLAGYLADRFAAQRVVIAGALLYALAMWLMTRVDGASSLLLVLGLLTGLAQSATTYVVVLGAVGRVVGPQRRASAFGVVTGLGSFGLFLMVPLASHWLLSGGWSWAFETLAWTALVMLFAAVFLPGALPAQATRGLGLMPLLGAAVRHRGYLLLIAGFFVCGFHVAFIATHLPAYAVDMGLDSASAANALALIGLFNILGSFLFGWLGDRYRKKFVLSWLYGLRAMVIGGFVLIPLSETSALLFGALIGVLWLATVPVTSGMVGQLFGARYLGTLYGLVFLGHQLGAFLGAWWGGRVFESTGSYDTVWWVAVLLSLLAAVIHGLIDDRPGALAPIAAGVASRQ